MGFRFFALGLALCATACVQLPGALSETGERRPELDRLESAEAWEQLVETIRIAGEQVIREGENGALDRRDAIERYQGLLAILSNTLRLPLNQDPARPLILPSDLLPALTKIGGNSPDADYHGFPVSPEYRYRLHGKRGGAAFFSIQVQSMEIDLLRMQPRLRLASALTDDALALDDDGRFEVVISRERPEGWTGQWLAMDDDSFVVNVREYHHDRANEAAPELQVELLDPIPAPEPLTDEEVARRLRSATFMSRFWIEARRWMPELLEPEKLNTFAFDQRGDSDDALALASDVQYMTGAWQLGPDEMLVIEGRPPEAPYWMIQIMDRWLDTADFRRRRVHLNDAQVVLEADGSYRIAVAPRDPGLPNWLDTGGRREGYMAFRWVLATGVEAPTVRRVPIDEWR